MDSFSTQYTPSNVFVPKSAFHDAAEQAAVIELINARADSTPIHKRSGRAQA